MRRTFPFTAKIILILLMLAFILSLTACTPVYHYNLQGAYPDISQTGITTIAVGTLDQRSFILDGEKKPDFVGLQRSQVGIPYDVLTASGNPFANDVSVSAELGLDKIGSNANFTSIPFTATPQEAKDAIFSLEQERSLFIVINKWKTDSYYSVYLSYDLQAFVYDKEGNLLAENRTFGSDKLGGDMFNILAYARNAATSALSQKLDQLIDTQVMLDALLR